MDAIKYKSIPHMLRTVNSNKTFPDLPFAYNLVYNDSKVSLSSYEFYLKVSYLSLALDSILTQGKFREKIVGAGILADSSPRWLMADFSSQINKCHTVPLFTNLSLSNFEFELSDGDVKFIFIENLASVPENLKPAFDKLDFIITLEDYNKSYDFMVERKHYEKSDTKVYYFQELLDKGLELFQNDSEKIDRLIDDIDPSDIATIVYTSGSTGTPKGAVLSHQNLCFQLETLERCIDLNQREDRAMAVLPLAHIFQRTITYLYISNLCKIYFSDDIKNLAIQIKIIKPHILIVVPRVLKKIYANATIKAKNSLPILSSLLIHAINIARKDSYLHHGFFHKFYDILMYRKVRKNLGGNLRLLVCGGAALHPEINNFFLNLKIPVYQGYGMTEHAPVISTNTPEYNRLGSVGKVIEDVQIKLTKDHEILVKSPSVMQGYYKDEALTKSVIDDGWLHTGDLGYLDNDNYLFLTGRKKELHKTSTGKYVSPAPIEMKLAHSRMIEHALIIADNRRFVSVLIFLDKEYINRLPFIEKTMRLHKIPFLKHHLNRIIDQVNQDLNEWEQVKKHCIIDDFATTENDLLTPTLKLKRSVVEKKYSKLIEKIYDEKTK